MRGKMKETVFKPTRFNTFMIRLTFILIPAAFFLQILHNIGIMFEKNAPLWVKVVSMLLLFVWIFGAYVTSRVFWSRGEEVDVEEDEEDEEEDKSTDVYSHLDDDTDSTNHWGD